MINSLGTDLLTKRASSAFIDHLMFSFAAAIVTFPGVVFEVLTSSFKEQFYTGSTVLNTIGLTIYLSKDLIFQQTPAKRLLHLMLIDHQTKQSANSIQRVIRNLPIFLWPVEAFIILIPPYRRLGDIMARTAVVPLGDNEVVLRYKRSIFLTLCSIFIAIFSSYLYVLAYSLIIGHLNSMLDT